MALPGLEQGLSSALQVRPESSRAALPSVGSALGSAGGFRKAHQEAVGGTKVPSACFCLICDLVEVAVEAGAPVDHPKLVEARAWLEIEQVTLTS